MGLFRRFILAIIFFMAAAAAAETVYMRDGRVFTGRILNQTRTEITLQTAQGTFNISKDQIRRIQYDNPQLDAQKAEEARRLEEQRREEERRLQEQRLREYEKQQELQRQQNELRLQEERKRREEEEAKKRAEEDKKPGPDTRPAGREDPREWYRKEQAKTEQALKDQAEKARLLGPTWYGALARNLVVPGWGEVYQGRRSKGMVMAGSWAALTGFMLYESERYRINYTNYADTTKGFLIGTPLFVRTVLNYSMTDAQGFSWLFLGSDQTARSRERMQTHALRLRAAKTALVGLYAFGIVDVLLFKPQADTKVGLQSDGENLGLAFTARF